MKKVALSLLAFALAGGMVSAQAALKLSGSLQTGVYAEMAAGKSKAYMYESDFNGPMSRLRLDGAYDAGNTGLNFRFEGTQGAVAYVFDKYDTATSKNLYKDGNGTIAVKNAYVWAKFLEKTVTLKVGNVDDGLVKTQGDLGKDFDQNVWVSYTGVPGLAAALSFGYPVADPLTKTEHLQTGVQAKYTVDKVASVVAGVLAGGVNVKTANLGAEVLAVSGLTLAADTQITGLDKPKGKDESVIIVSEKASYKLDALTINFMAYQFLYGADTAKVKSDVKQTTAADVAPLGLWVRPSVAYTLDPITSVELFVKYLQGSAVQALATPGNDKNEKTAANNISAIEPKVVATFTLDSKAKILVGGGVQYFLSDKDYTNFGLKDAADAKSGDPMKLFLNVDFRYSF